MERYYISYLGNIAEYLIYQSEHFPRCLNQTNIIDNALDHSLHLSFTPSYLQFIYLLKNVY